MNVYDLIFNGADCSTLREKSSDKYLVLEEDSGANCGRGSSSFFYKGELVCSEMMKHHRVDRTEQESLIMRIALLDASKADRHKKESKVPQTQWIQATKK